MANTPRTPAADPDPGPRILARAVAECLRLARPARRLIKSHDRIHKLRIATRRAQAVTAVLEPRLGQDLARDLAAPLRKLRRSAGRARDAHIRLTILTRELPDPGKPARRLIKDLEARHDRELHDLRRVAKKRRAQAAEALDAARERLARPGPTLDTLAARTERRLRSEIVRLARGDLDDSGRLHKLRRALKRLRYTIELVESQPGVKARLRTLARLQDRLGEWNDLRITLETLGSACETSGPVPAQHRRLARRVASAHARAVRAVKAWTAGPKARRPPGPGRLPLPSLTLTPHPPSERSAPPSIAMN